MGQQSVGHLPQISLKIHKKNFSFIHDDNTTKLTSSVGVEFSY